MNGLRPYSHVSAPLTGGARFIRGFRRIGAALGIMAFTIGAGTTVTIAVTQQMSAEKRFDQASCMADRARNNWTVKTRSYDSTRIDFEASGCPNGPLYLETMPAILELSRHPPGPLEYAGEPVLYGLPISITSAAFLYFGFWLLGWLCAGFTRD